MTSSLLPYLPTTLGAFLMTASIITTPAAQAAPSSEELLVSPGLPVVDRPLQIFLPKDAASAPVRYVVTSEATGEVVAEQEGVELEHGVGIEWTAPETGYYVATAETTSSPSQRWTVRFPVVYRDLHFTIWPDLQPEEHNLRYLASHVILPGASKNPEMVAEWKKRGSKVLGATFTGGRQIKLDESDEANVDRLVTAWTKAFAEGCDGIYIDEIGGYPSPSGLRKFSIASKALLRFREENPEALIYVAVAGSLVPEFAMGMKSAGAVALLETYESWLTAGFATHRFYDYLDGRIDVARRTDLIRETGKPNAAVIFIGYDGLHGGTSKVQLEEAVRHAKTQAPEMPGMAFYASRRTWEWLRDTEIRTFANELCERYFIQPVLEIHSIWLEQQTPQAGQPVTVTVRVHNVGGMQARDVRVRLYASPVGLNERHEIGSVTLDKVGVGQIDIKDESLTSNTAYRYEEVGGEQVPAFSAYGTVSQDRESAKFSWTPETAGAYVLHAVLEASPDFTVLTGVRNRDVVVASPTAE